MRIGLLSDTHGWLDDRIFEYFQDCDEVWHAGDIGHVKLIQTLEAFKPLRAVHGNIDGQDIRRKYPRDLRFTSGGLRVWMTHIGGRPPHYTPHVLASLGQTTPDLFISGHSHILRVEHDARHTPLLYLNPGAAGKEGFHEVRTVLRFTLHRKKVREMRAIELGHRAQISL